VIICASCGVSYQGYHVCVQPLTEADLRRVLREELDRKPAGWQAYAEACVELFEHSQLRIRQGWNVDTLDLLEAKAKTLRPKP